MSDDADEPDESELEGPAADKRLRTFHLEVGLRPLSGLLGPLIEADVTKSAPPPGDEVDWTPVDETSEDHQRRDVPTRRKRTKRVRQTKAEKYFLNTRFEDDEFVVTADIPGATKDDLAIGVDRNTNKLVIKKNETILGRVTLPWDSVEPTRVWFNNGILEVRVRSDDL